MRSAIIAWPLLVAGSAAAAPAVLVHQPDGLVDLSTHRAIAPAISLYDADRELVWYLTDHVLYVRDLRGDHAPVAIVERVMTDGFAIDGVRAGQANAVVALTWSKRLGDSGPVGPPESMPTESDEEQALVAQAKLVGAAWLDANRGRKRRAIASLGFTTTVAIADPDLTGRGECEGGRCGRAAALGKTGLHLVVTESYKDHDGQHHGCSLYDAKAKRFVDEPADKTVKLRVPCAGQLDRDLQHYLTIAWESGAGAILASCTRAGCEVIARGRDGQYRDPGARVVDPF